MDERSAADRAWTIALLLGGLASALHLLTAADSWDLFRDELYYLANARHLGAGYVDHPPLVGWITAGVRAGLGASKLALRLVPALAAGGTVVAACGIARELGGSRWALILAGTATALAPTHLALFGILSMNAMDVLFWALGFWTLARLLGTGDLAWWVPFGAIAGLALENKLSALFLLFGLAAGLLLTRDWRHFRSRSLWTGALVAAVLAAPYLLWQVAHDWPTVEFMRNASQSKNLPFSPLAYLAAQVPMMGYLAVPLALAGLILLVAGGAGRPWRPLGWALVAILALMVTQRAKPYYFAPAFTLLFAAGGVAVERWTGGPPPKRVWLRPAYLALLVAADLAMLPMVKPVLGVEATVAYQRALGLEPGTDERKQLGRLSQFFADRVGWRELAATVAEVHRSLAPSDRDRACVFGQNYGQAGAIDFYGPELGLPPAVSGHNSYWLWGPGQCSGEVLIVIGGRREDLEAGFHSVEHAATYRCADCMPYEAVKEIWIARGLRLPLEQAWPTVRHYD